MRALYTILLLTVTTVFGYGQILEPVTWSMDSRHVSGDEYELVFTATIDEGWSIYSQHTADGGPIPTSFNFDDGEHYTRNGAVAEKGKKKEGADPLFDGITVIKFVSSPVVFTQKVTAADINQPITGWLEYMTCDDERCLPPTEVDFSFKLEPSTQETAPAPVEDKGSAANTKTIPATPMPQEGEAQSVTAVSLEKEEKSAEITGEASATTATVSAIEPSNGDARFLQPVRWQLEAQQQGADVVQLVFTAHMEEGWSIYSQNTDDNGPVPTTFYWDGEGYERQGDAQEQGDMKEGADPLFGGVIVKKYPHGPVTFTQQVKLTGAEKISGAVEFMTCDDERCLPPSEVPFEVSFAPLAVIIGDSDNPPPPPAPKADYSGENKLAGITPSTEFNVKTTSAPLGECGESVDTAGKGIWQIFGLGFLGGLIALLTPCVFPMIPLTVSFFTKGSEDRSKGLTNAFLYGFFIFAVYILLSVPFHLMDSLDPDILNKISTNVALNVFFFVIFLFFAGSFFGFYELTVPESWTNKASSAEGSGGMVGIFFMALTLALVSFSCTGPILGTLLVGALSSDGGAMQLTAGMGGFGMALALPFALFAAFPSMMSSLPKSGGWLNSVKVVLGFLEVALAFKFLSNADLVDHWNILKIEPFLLIWILTFLGLGLYLFGKIKFPHDSPIKKLSPLRIGLGVVSFAFMAYLASGFLIDPEKGSYRPLTLLSGLAPPVCYSFFNPCECPQQLDCFKELKSGLAFAEENNKPVMIDFTGYACVNCRRMEENVWPEPEVYSYLKDDYVVISLYVDDKEELMEAIRVENEKGREKQLDEVGEKWALLQRVLYNQNSQPQYVLISPDGKKLNNPVNYTPDVDEYADFLRCGLENFRRMQDGGQQLGSR